MEKIKTWSNDLFRTNPTTAIAVVTTVTVAVCAVLAFVLSVTPAALVATALRFAHLDWVAEQVTAADQWVTGLPVGLLVVAGVLVVGAAVRGALWTLVDSAENRFDRGPALFWCAAAVAAWTGPDVYVHLVLPTLLLVGIALVRQRDVTPVRTGVAVLTMMVCLPVFLAVAGLMHLVGADTWGSPRPAPSRTTTVATSWRQYRADVLRRSVAPAGAA